MGRASMYVKQTACEGPEELLLRVHCKGGQESKTNVSTLDQGLRVTASPTCASPQDMKTADAVSSATHTRTLLHLLEHVILSQPQC